MKVTRLTILLLMGLFASQLYARTPGELAYMSNLVIVGEVVELNGPYTFENNRLVLVQALNVVKGSMGSFDMLVMKPDEIAGASELSVGRHYLLYLSPVRRNNDIAMVDGNPLYQMLGALPYPARGAVTVSTSSSSQDTMLQYSILTAQAQDDGYYVRVLLDYISLPSDNPARTTAISDLSAYSDRWVGPGPILSASDRRILLNALNGAPYGDPLKVPLIRILGNARAPEAVETITLALRGRGGEVLAHEAGIALRKIGDPAAMTFLAERISEYGPMTRANTATAMGYYGNPDCVPYLLTGLNDKFAIVRINSIVSLGLIRDERGAAPLIQLYQSAAFDEKKLILQSLAWIKSPVAYQFIVELLAKVVKLLFFCQLESTEF